MCVINDNIWWIGSLVHLLYIYINPQKKEKGDQLLLTVTVRADVVLLLLLFLDRRADADYAHIC